MPQRPRQHQLDRQAVEDFRRRLPLAWVPRVVEPDYGIDQQVEIFGANGLATGRAFAAQVKGTDEVALKKALRVRLKVTTVSYLREQDLPVLIARFHAPTNSLFVKWFHAFDIHYGRKGQRSVTLNLSEGDRWVEETPNLLVEEIERFRYLRSRRLQFPIAVRLNVTEDVRGVGQGTLRLRIRAVAEKVADIVRLADDRDAIAGAPRVVAVVVEDAQTVVNAGSAPTVTLHHSFEYDEDADDSIAADVLVALALWMGHVGEDNAAARLAKVVGAQSNAVTDLDTLGRLVTFFVRSHRVVEALELAEGVRRRGLGVVSQLLSAAALFNVSSQSAAEQSAVEIFLRRASDRADEADDANEGRAAEYSLGNFLRNRDNEEAFARYARAAELDPSYLDRPYFCSELAGILFHLGEFESAAYFYERALDIGASGLTRALLADSLMSAGEYALALRHFRGHSETDSGEPAEFALKRLVLPALINVVGDRQRRLTEEANALASVGPGAAVSDDVFDAALDKDALCSLAWFNRGVSLARAGKTEQALDSFLLAALNNLGDVEAWANALGLAMSSSTRLPLAPLIFEAGYHLNGTRLLERLVVHAQSQAEGFPADDFLAAIDELVATVSRERPRPVLRILGEEGRYEEVFFGPSDEDVDAD